jgi:hypothetical protein
LTLAERRIVHEFETSHFPALKARVEEAAGFAVPLEPDWATLAVPGESHLYAELWPTVFFEPLIAALAVVGRDDMGREAMSAGLKKIVLQNTKGCIYGNCWASFQDGVLTLDHEPLTNAYDTESRKEGIIAMLEKSL